MHCIRKLLLFFRFGAIIYVFLCGRNNSARKRCGDAKRIYRIADALHANGYVATK